MNLATMVFEFMNSSLLCHPSVYVQKNTRQGLSEGIMTILAAIIKDLDREMSRSDGVSGGIGKYLIQACLRKRCQMFSFLQAFFFFWFEGSDLTGTYDAFSRALAGYTHNLIAIPGLLSHALQTSLLTLLGVNPSASDTDWPLLIYPRSLGVLAQVRILVWVLHVNCVLFVMSLINRCTPWLWPWTIDTMMKESQKLIGSSWWYPL